MGVDERARHQLRVRLGRVLGDEPAGTLMGYLPPVGWADVATTRDLDLLAAELRAEIAGLRGEMHVAIAGLRGEMHQMRGDLRSEIAALRDDLSGQMRRLFFSLAALMVTLFAISAATS